MSGARITDKRNDCAGGWNDTVRWCRRGVVGLVNNSHGSSLRG
uniref:Uncharacterized protein n=1 Tax=Manihot esculenta TaxID=3983 RepID=A0A2C9UYN5_MANES